MLYKFLKKGRVWSGPRLKGAEFEMSKALGEPKHTDSRILWDLGAIHDHEKLLALTHTHN